MDKKLPGIYANKIDKKLTNNESVYYSSSNVNDDRTVTKLTHETKKVDGLNINQKINNIFNSNRYVYKADVIITTNEGKITKKIIGQNNTHLITIENELIPISNILDIEFNN